MRKYLKNFSMINLTIRNLQSYKIFNTFKLDIANNRTDIIKWSHIEEAREHDEEEEEEGWR